MIKLHQYDKISSIWWNFISMIKKHLWQNIHCYEERLIKLKLPSLVYRRLRGDYIETFKILTNIYDPLTTKTLLTIDNNTRTRNNSFKLVKPRVNYKPYQEFFTNRIISKWNRLPPYVVKATSLNSFKNRLDNHFKDIMFKIWSKLKNQTSSWRFRRKLCRFIPERHIKVKRKIGQRQSCL